MQVLKAAVKWCYPSNCKLLTFSEFHCYKPHVLKTIITAAISTITVILIIFVIDVFVHINIIIITAKLPVNLGAFSNVCITKIPLFVSLKILVDLTLVGKGWFGG